MFRFWDGMVATLTEFSYYNVSNYDAKGLKRSFVVDECTCFATSLGYVVDRLGCSDVLATMEEWCSCAILMATYLTSRYDAEERKKRLGLEDNYESGDKPQA